MAKSLALLVTLVIVFLTSVRASDPELINDFAVPDGVDESNIDGTFFTHTGLRGGAPASSNGIGRKTVSVKDFPALNGMGVSLELLEFPAGTVNSPHTHPRGSEILFMVDGSLTVETMDSNGKRYKNVLQKGDVFVFPKGLPHYQTNLDKTKAVAVSAFASSNAGTVAMSKNVAGAKTPDEILTNAFKISADTLHELMKSTQN